jgi:hypothetical protein
MKDSGRAIMPPTRIDEIKDTEDHYEFQGTYGHWKSPRGPMVTGKVAE